MIGNFAQIGVLLVLFQAPPPTLTTVNPNGGPTAGGTFVVLTGTNFQSGAMVFFDGVSASSVMFVSSTTLTAVTPGPHPAGAVPVTVTNPDSQSSTRPNAFTYRLPTIISNTPNSGSFVGGRSVRIDGTNFTSSATVQFGGTASPSVIVNNGTSITAVTPPHAAGQVDIVVTNSDGQSATRTNGYTYVSVTIGTIDPILASSDGGTPFTITGMNFFPPVTLPDGGTAVTLIFFDVTVAVDVTVDPNTTLIRGTIPPHSPTLPDGGPAIVNITARNPSPPAANSDVLVGAFRYDADPILSSVNPSTGRTSGETLVTLTGANFDSGATVTFGGNPATIVGGSDSSLTATTPAGNPGTVSVVVRNPDGLSATLVNSFTYGSGPRLDRVTPDSGPIAGGTAVVLSGVNFMPGATVQFDGTPAPTANFVSATSLMATTPGHSAGPVNVVIRNPDLQFATSAGAFSYLGPPTLSRVSPSSGDSTGSTQVTLSGSNFSPGARVSFGGADATDVTVSGGATISAKTPPHGPGAVDVVVTNTDGQSATLPGSFVFQSNAIQPTQDFVDSSASAPKGCAAAASIPSVLGLTALLLWLQRRRRRQKSVDR